MPTRAPASLAAIVALPVVVTLALLTFSSETRGAPDAGAPAATNRKTKVVGPPEVAWKDLDADQRARYMKLVVTPKMRPLFQQYDAKLFAKFDCATCHGKGAKARKFKMPSPDIAPLPNTPEAFQAKLKTEESWPRWTKFMAEVVVPQTAAVLGVPAFDHQKPQAGGFSCNGCHALEGEK